MNSDRNIYKEDVNFTELASQDADFAKVLKSNGQLDFSDPEAVQQLTKSLLKRDFNLGLSLPPDRLCPPVPNRLNYILWIQDLLDTTSKSYSDRYDPKREVIGLDIGTGASCIYPLLGCSQRSKWRFAATDIDDLSLKYAQENITTNNFNSRIKLLKTTPSDPLIPLDSIGFLDTLDFTLCNPPFYASQHELLASATLKQRPPNSACTGSATEMVYEAEGGGGGSGANPTTRGGEISFVLRIIAESLLLRDKIQWYTTMLGKLSSVPTIVQELRKHGVENWAVAEFVQGTRTRRWGVGWSFWDLRPAAGVARAVSAGGGGVPRSLLPFPGEYVVKLEEEDVERTTRRLNEVLSALLLRWIWKEGIRKGVGLAGANVWSRAARRKSARARETMRRSDDGEDTEHEAETQDEDEMVFGFKITVRSGGQDGLQEEEGVQVIIRWLKGFDSALFESFCGMIKRKLEE